MRSDDSGAEAELHATEAAMLSPRAHVRRRKSFRAGRLAARQALRALGLRQPPPVERGPRGEPLWPDEVTGSLSHTEAYAAAVVAWRKEFVALGLDIENTERPMDFDLGRHIATPPELAWLDERPAQRHQRSLMLFSAKESIYKALYPVCGRFFGFDTVSLRWVEASCRFYGHLTETLGPDFPVGHPIEVGCRVEAGLVLTWVQIPA